MSKDELMREGYWYYCFGCKTAYKTPPIMEREGERVVMCPECRCAAVNHTASDRRVRMEVATC